LKDGKIKEGVINKNDKKIGANPTEVGSTGAK
jgi:hypothetical protein